MSRPSAIVLCRVATGLAVVRSLASRGINVHAVLFAADDPLHYSRFGVKVKYYEHRNQTTEAGTLQDQDAKDALADFLFEYASRLGDRPLIIPTCDENALLLAKHRLRLSRVSRIWSTPYDHLSDIINKDALYRIAIDHGIPVLPSLSGQDYEGVEMWTAQYSGPYLLKPTYHQANTSHLGTKNKVMATREDLLHYVKHHGVKSLVIQLFRWGGDGEIYDAYGLCNSRGQVVTIASHRRIRQCAPNLGATSYGEIPAQIPEGEVALFGITSKLLSALTFHGIFGIEWLRDRETGQLYLIDFNARPFLSIGHLVDCGLDLPWLAYRELMGDDLADVDLRPRLQHRYWVDLLRDVQGFRAKAPNRPIAWDWASSLLKVSSHAYWSWRDPGPALLRLGAAARNGMGAIGKAFGKGGTADGL